METTIEQLENGSISDQIIEIKSVYKTGKHTIQPAFDAKIGWWAGVDRLTEDDKKGLRYYVKVGLKGEHERENTRIVLQEGLTFNLTNEVDRTNWMWVKECKDVLAMSLQDAQSSKALFYVHIEGRESEISNKKTELQFKAMTLVMEDPTTNYVNRALLLGMDMEHERPSTIKEFLLEKAKDKPTEIIRVYEGNTMKLHLLYLMAKKANQITVGSDNVIKYKEHILGMSDDSAVAYLQSNKEILGLIERDVNPQYFEEKATKVHDSQLSNIQKAQLAAKEKREQEEAEAKK